MTKEELKKEIAKYERLLKKDRAGFKKRKEKIAGLFKEMDELFAGLKQEQAQKDDKIRSIFEEFDQKMIKSLPEG